MSGKRLTVVIAALLVAHAWAAHAAELRGRVLDHRGEPLGRGGIAFMALSDYPRSFMQGLWFVVNIGDYVRACQLEADGSYVVDGIESGDYVCHCIAAGEEKGDRQIDYLDVLPIAPGTTELDVRLPSGGLTATVRDPDLKPVAYIYVRLIPAGTTGARRQRLTRRLRTDEEGKFAVWPLPPGDYEVRIERSSFRQVVRSRVMVGDAEVERDIVLVGPGRLTGTIRMADGSPVTQTLVYLTCDDPIDCSGAAVRSDGVYDTGCDVTPGTWLAFVWRAGYSVEAARLRIPQDTVFNATLTRSGDLKVALAGKPEAIADRIVRVRDEKGAEVLRDRAGPFWLIFTPARYAVAPTNRLGETMLYGLRPSQYTVAIDGSTITATVRIRAGETAEARLPLK